MLALKERPPLSWPEYSIAYPTEFYTLIGFESPKYVRGLLSKNHSSKKYIHLLGNTKSKRLTDLKSFKNETSRYVRGILNNESKSVNCYFTPNEFFRWPKTKNLALLKANWIEIDLNNKCSPDEVRNIEKKTVNEVFHRLQLSKVPPPTGYVLSGSGGMHIYWIYEPVEAKSINKQLWREITKRLIESIGKSESFWHVDVIATNRANGFMRIPGTVHGKTGLHARYYNSGYTYTFNEMLLSLDLEQLSKKLKELALNRKSKVISLPKREKVKQNNKKRHGHSIKEWWMKCINSIQMHFNNIGFVPQGKRDKTAFILFVAYQHLNKKTAFERLSKFNNELIGFSTEELNSLTSAAKNTFYKYKKETLSTYLEDLLGYTPEYLNTQPKVKLSNDEIKQRQKRAAQDTASKKRTNSQVIVRNAIRELTMETGKKPIQRKVAERTGLGLRTVKRYW